MTYRVSIKSLFISLGLAALAGLGTSALWRAGLFDSLQSIFVVGSSRADAPIAAPQPWLSSLLIITVGGCAGFFVGRVGLRRSFLILGLGFLILCGASLWVSYQWRIDIQFAPMALGAMAAVFLVQLYRLWEIDAVLTRRVNLIASTNGEVEFGRAQARLLSGLKLLHTILPLEESIVYQPNEDGELVPCARLRPSPAASLDPGRNKVWRTLIKLCDRALEKDQINRIRTGELDGLENVAIPLRHEAHSVGVLLLRMTESFDQSDRSLLFAVGGQLARNLQREKARNERQNNAMPTFVSTHASGRRLEAFDVVSGFLIEHRFGPPALAEAFDGHAVAYLDGTLAYINPAMLEVAGLEEAEAANLDLFTLLDRFRYGVFNDPSIAVRRVLQSGEAYQTEITLPATNTNVELRIALATERNSNGNGGHALPLCFAIRARDITKDKEHEQMKSDMISLMSHELRTPLTSINGFAELLVRDRTLPDESREFLQIISSESQRMARMIDTFLSVTKLERSDKQEVTKSAVRLDQVVRDVITTLQPLARKKRIRLAEQASPQIPPVAADKGLMTQVVTNLIDNAIKYSPERTTVTITTTLEAEAVRVTIEDRGYGVPPESIDRIWEKFYRVARDGQEKHEESTGLGLSVVKDVVEQHGGTVVVESEVGRGSKFSFGLPRL